MPQITQNHAIAFLNVILMCEVLLESLDELKGTSLYRHELKSKVGLLKPQLEKVIENDLASIWGVDDKAMYHLIDQQKLLVHRLSTTRPEIWNMVNELLNMYEQDKEGFLKLNEITINA